MQHAVDELTSELTPKLSDRSIKLIIKVFLLDSTTRPGPAAGVAFIYHCSNHQLQSRETTVENKSRRQSRANNTLANPGTPTHPPGPFSGRAHRDVTIEG